jgi:hypothetical protein
MIVNKEINAVRMVTVGRFERQKKNKKSLCSVNEKSLHKDVGSEVISARFLNSALEVTDQLPQGKSPPVPIG